MKYSLEVFFLKCPVCFGNTKVIRTLVTDDCVYRRRFCNNCHHIFYTGETDLPDDIEYKSALEERKGKK